MTGAVRDRKGVSGEDPGTSEQEPGQLVRRKHFGLLFFALVVLLPPIFAHGCHGDDVDHEPGAVPLNERRSPGPVEPSIANQ